MNKHTPGDNLRFLLSKATPESTIEMNLPAARHTLEVIDAMYDALQSADHHGRVRAAEIIESLYAALSDLIDSNAPEHVRAAIAARHMAERGMDGK